MNTLVETPSSGPLNDSPPSSRAPVLGRILVCVDRSPFSEACLPHAVAVAKSLGGTITLLHVLQAPHERSGLHTTDVLDWEISRQEARVYLERLERAGTQALGCPITTRLEQGRPAERITSVAREINADLTVLGSRGESGVAAWHLGSTVLQVLAVTCGSVLLSRGSLAATEQVSPKRILVPLDGSLRTESVLPTATRLARTHGAELLLVFIVREPVATAVLRAPEDLDLARDLAARLEARAGHYLNDLRDQLVRSGASARTLVLRSANEAQTLLVLSREQRSDLIILSAHGSTCDPGSTVGSVTACLLTQSAVAVLVLQDLGRAEPSERETGQSSSPPYSFHPEGS